MEKDINALTSYAWPKAGGMHARFMRAMRALAAQGIGAHWITVRPDLSPHPGIMTHRVRINRSEAPDHTSTLFWMIFNLKTAWIAAGLVLRRRCDRLFAFSLACAVPLLPASMLRRIPFVVFIRSDERKEYEIKLKRGWLMRTMDIMNGLVARRASRLVFVNRTLMYRFQDRYGGDTASKSELLYNEIPAPAEDTETARRDLESMAGAPPEAFIALTAGRIEVWKNTEVLLRAVAEIGDPGLFLVIVGNGSDRGRLAKMAVALGCQDRIVFTGWRDDAHRLISACDAFLLPSLTEGVSNALLEALAERRPCILSDIPEHRELFPGGENLFHPNSAGDLASLLNMLKSGGPESDAITAACALARNSLSLDWDSEVLHHIIK